MGAKLDFFGVSIDDISLDEAVSNFIQPPKSFRYIVTPNVDHYCRLFDTPYLRPLYEQADLCLCDSRVLQIIGKISGRRLNNVVRGSDMVESVLNKLPKHSRLMVVGDSHEIKKSIINMFGFIHVDVIAPSYGFINNKTEVNGLIEKILHISPEYIFLAVGSPQQEMIAHRLAQTDLSATAICCGNAINFSIGRVIRCPQWMSNFGIEWLHRVLMEPRRLFFRYVKNLKILYIAYKGGV